jgi:hypothetical protein
MTSSNWVNTGIPNMDIDAEMIIVDQGGKLIIEGSESTNINCDIYVNGGEIELMSTGQGVTDDRPASGITRGADLFGNIYVYNNGLCKIDGNFYLQSPAIPNDNNKDGTVDAGEYLWQDKNSNNKLDANELVYGGIFIFGSSTISNNHVTAGRIDAPGSATITEPASKISVPEDIINAATKNTIVTVDTVGPGSVHILNKNYPVQTFSPNLICDNHTDKNMCKHFSTSTAGWIIGQYTN